MNRFYLSFLIIFCFAQNAFAQKAENFYTINISTGAFIPEAMTPTQILEEQPTDVFGGNYFKLIQFYELPTDEERNQMVTKGLTLVDYLPKYTYFAVINQSFDWNSINLQNVRSVIEPDARFKKEAPLFFNGIPPHAMQNGEVQLIVSFYKTLEISELIPFLNQIGKVTEQHPEYYQVNMSVRPENLDVLVAVPFVQFIGAIDPEPIEEGTAWIRNSRSSYITSGHNGLNYSGDGVVIMVSEGGGLDPDSLDYKGRLIELSGGSGGHKQGVALRMGGAGNNNPKNKGIAYGADVISSGSTNYSGYYSTYNLRFTNHSYGWGVPGSGFYNSGARSRDIFVNNNPAGIVSYSAGNNGGAVGPAPYNFAGWSNVTGPTKYSKNNFATASVNQTDAHVNFSSRGPVYDGRMIPQIAVEGSGGTSYASPKTIGQMAIMHEVYRDKNGGTEPTSSLLKAVMLNTADDVYTEGIDFRTGYGRMNARRAYNVIDAGQIITDQVSTGETDVHNIVVPANTSQVRIMIYWADEEASVNAAKALVNDLKLEVTDPSMTTYNPWVLDHTADPVLMALPATRQVDTLNNTEQVTIDNPATGTYTVEVTGDAVPFGPEEYYLVYEFLGNELTLTAPAANFNFVPGSSEYIHWDTYGSTDDVVLEYQIDGGSWTSIATEAYDAGGHNWSPPSVLGIKTLKVRATRGALTSESSVGTIGAVPSGLKVDWACADAIKVSWNSVAGADGYQVYTLGAKYMEPVTTGITYNSTSAILTGMSTTEDVLLAVAAKTGSVEGLRSNAIEKTVGDVDCANFYTKSPQAVSKTSATFVGHVNPHNATLTDVKFEYGTTTAYGSETSTITVGGTGHDQDTVSVTETVTITQTAPIHYRIKGLVNGTPFFGEDRIAKLAPGRALVGTGGSNEYMEIQESDSLKFLATQDFSVSLWIKTTSTLSEGTIISDKDWDSGSNVGWGSFIDDGEWEVNISNGQGTRKDQYSIGVINDGNWHHLVSTIDRDGLMIAYMDGEEMESIDISSLNNFDLITGMPMGILADGESDYELDATIDEVSIFRKVLTKTEIEDMFHHPLSGNESRLVGYWTFDQDLAEVEEISQDLGATLLNGATKTTSTVPFGVGATEKATESVGAINFPNADLSLNFAIAGTADLLAAKIDLIPNDTVGVSASAKVFTDEYWVLHRYGSGNFDASITFSTSADITASDEATPSHISVYARDAGSDGAWVPIGVASSANAANDEVTISGLTGFSKQYLLARDTDPFLSVSETDLTFLNQKVGCTDDELIYDLSGFNLISDVTVTAPDNFEISESSGIGFAPSLVFTPVNSTVLKTLYLRANASKTGIYTGQISHSSPGATTSVSSISPVELVSVTGKAGKSRDMDGNTDYFIVEDLNWNAPSSYTIEWWLKPASFRNWNHQIGNGWGNFLFHGNSNRTVSLGPGNNSTRINSTTTFPLNEWTHIAYTYDNGSGTLYLNGELEGTATGTDNVYWTTFRIGANSSNNSINGEIDEFRMWETARSATEIRENMHLTLVGNEANLRVYLQFHTNNGNLVDLSPNCYNVTNYGNSTVIDSDLAVASGVSVSKDVTATGSVSFDNGGDETDLDINFPTTHPNGQVVVSKLIGEAPHGTSATSDVTTPYYWIVKNYGSTNTGLAANITFTAPNGLMISNALGSYEMFKRGSVSTGSWDTAISATAANSSTNLTTFSGINDFSQFIIGAASVKISPKIFLEGAYTGSMMHDSLRAKNLIPDEEPYSGLGFGGFGNICLPPAVKSVTGNDAIVDWVFLELRDKNNSATIVQTRTALVQRDGDIVSVFDGTSPVSLSVADDNYFVVIRHRNHFGVMSPTTLTLSETSTVIDFTSGSAFGTNAQKDLGGGIFGLWMSDSNASSVIDAADRAKTWNERTNSDYRQSDLNLDGEVDSADRVKVWDNRNLIEQVPK